MEKAGGGFCRTSPGLIHLSMRAWRNWQTRQIWNLVGFLRQEIKPHASSTLAARIKNLQAKFRNVAISRQTRLNYFVYNIDSAHFSPTLACSL
jgi:hypothetical protein